MVMVVCGSNWRAARAGPPPIPPTRLAKSPAELLVVVPCVLPA